MTCMNPDVTEPFLIDIFLKSFLMVCITSPATHKESQYPGFSYDITDILTIVV